MEWYFLVLISAITLSFWEVIRKKILKKEHSLELLSVSYLTIVILQLFLLPFIDLKIPMSFLLITFVRSMIVAIAILMMTRALHHMEISSVLPMKNITPFFLLFLSAVFLGEQASFWQIMGIVLIVAGSYFLQIHSHYLDFFRHLKELKNKYVYYMLGSAALLSIAAMLSKIVLTSVKPLTYMFYSNIFIAGYFIISLFIHYDGIADIRLGFYQGKWWILALGCLAITTDITYYSAIAAPTALISLVVPIRRLSTLFSTVIGGRMFHDHYLFHKIVSAIVLVMGACLVILG